MAHRRYTQMGGLRMVPGDGSIAEMTMQGRDGFGGGIPVVGEAHR